MKRSKIILGLALFSILAGLFLYMAGYFTDKLPQQRLIKVSDYANIETAIIKQRSVPILYEFTGTVVADQQALISARLTARVAETLVHVGDHVKQGDILMRLESRDLDARVKQSEQALSSAQARLYAARKEYTRVDELVNQKLLSQSEYDKAESELKTAQANFRQAEAAVSEAQVTFGFSMITAPFDGVITKKNVNRGDTAAPGMALLSMYNPEQLQLEVNISEAQIRFINVGSKLDYQLPTYGVFGQAKVIELTPAVDSSSRSFVVKLALDNQAKELVEEVYPGVYAKVSVYAGDKQVLVLPANSVYQVGQLDYVKIINQGVIQTRLVQLGDNFEVRKGLVAGDELVIEPLNYR